MLTRRIARELGTFRPLVHRCELFNRHELFSWVAEAQLPAIASGDVHCAAHLASWKTLLPHARVYVEQYAAWLAPKRLS